MRHSQRGQPRPGPANDHQLVGGALRVMAVHLYGPDESPSGAAARERYAGRHLGTLDLQNAGARQSFNGSLTLLISGWREISLVGVLALGSASALIINYTTDLHVVNRKLI